MMRSGDGPEARRLLELGDTAGARLAAERRLATAPGDTAASLVLATALVSQRQPAAALEILTGLIDRGDDSAEAFNVRGRARNNLGDPLAAERDFRRAIAADAGFADAHSNLGHILRGRRMWADAEAAFERALACDPGHQRALKALGTVYLETARPADATRAFERAIAAGGDSPELHGFLGAARHRCGDLDGAERAYRAALAQAPRHAECWLNLGIALQDDGRLSEALTAYREAVVLAPRSLAAHVRLAEACLADGLPDSALETAHALREMDPGHPAALAVEALALQALGREEEARRLADADRLVKMVDLQTPDGFDSVPYFNTALAEHVLAHPSLTFEPHGHATRRGRHTGDLLAGDKGPAALLEQAVVASVHAYLDTLDLPPDHPFPGRVPASVRLSMWAVVMESEGHQLPHIHPGAWLSGVYYVELPHSLGAGGEDRAGWIEFGLPPDELIGETRFTVCDFQPAEGRMFLFPSYLYHRTIPFAGKARRISIAFDVLRHD